MSSNNSNKESKEQKSPVQITKINISDKLSIYTCQNSDEKKQESNANNVTMVYLLDNSGSMGGMTKDCARAFGQIYDLTKTSRVNMHPGTLVLFNEYAQIHTSDIKCASDMKTESFPCQGSTDIRAGMECALDAIIRQNRVGMHYILVYMSDGEHNHGNPLNRDILMRYRKQINALQIKLSIVVAGIIHPDTGLGMMVKTQLETVDMPYLDSVYYAKSSIELPNVLTAIQQGLIMSLDNYSIVKLKLKGGTFINESLSSETSCMLSGIHKCYFAVRNENKCEFYVENNLITEFLERPLQYEDIVNIIDTITPKLAQKNVGSGVNSIKEQIKLLEELINSAEILLENILKSNFNGPTAEDLGKIQIKPLQRLQMIKKMHASSLNFRTERNKLKSLLMTIENNSAKQAEYLNGITKKFAAKAISRSTLGDVSVEQIYQDLVKIADEMAMIPESKQEVKNEGISMISLNTAIEQYQEWLTIKERKSEEFENEYAFLSFCGFIGYPVLFEHNNAVQMDPFQTRCIKLESCLIDSASIMLANQLNHEGFKSPNDREKMTDLLVLVSPNCPQHCILAMKSILYKLVCSVTLCRDLQMFNPRMTFSMYSHCFMKAIDTFFQTSSSSYLELAIQILYSAYKLKINFVKLFDHWFNECGSLTQNDNDNCNHPVQLLLLLGLNKTDSRDSFIPLINMLNEALCRIMKIKLANRDGRKLLQKLCNINESNSPKADMTDLLKEEPSNEEVKNSCRNVETKDIDHEILGEFKIEEKTVDEFVNNILSPYYRTFQVCLELHKYMGDEKWSDLSQKIENGELSKITDSIKNQLKDFMKVDLYTYLKVQDKSDLVGANMFLQASLYTDSGARANNPEIKEEKNGILDENVFELSTFRKMTVELMMYFYSEGCKIKRERYLAIIGDVTYADAIKATDERFDAILTSHTHGLTKQKFWALLRATKGSSSKKNIFLNKSNKTVDGCFRKKAYTDL